jgi:hypothetical protein
VERIGAEEDQIRTLPDLDGAVNIRDAEEPGRLCCIPGRRDAARWMQNAAVTTAWRRLSRRGKYA